jgi:hypothetical protein
MCSSTKISINLNLAVLEADIFKNLNAAVKISEKILGDSIEKLEDLDEEEYKAIDNLLENVKENV